MWEAFEAKKKKKSPSVSGTFLRHEEACTVSSGAKFSFIYKKPAYIHITLKIYTENTHFVLFICTFSFFTKKNEALSAQNVLARPRLYSLISTK